MKYCSFKLTWVYKTSEGKFKELENSNLSRVIGSCYFKAKQNRKPKQNRTENINKTEQKT